LERFFANELDNNQRERLLNLSPGDMQAELERLYVASEFGVRGVGAAGGGLSNPAPPIRPDIRPEDRRGRLGGPPTPEYFERDPRERGPNGPRGPRPDDRKDHRPPRGPGPPPPHHERQDAI
jgi:hypothetical protein